MFAEIVVLSWVLSRQPVKFSSEEREKNVFICSQITEVIGETRRGVQAPNIVTSTGPQTLVVKDFSSIGSPELLSVADRFRQLSAQWSAETSHVSSVTRAIANPSYQAIIKLGWDAVPLMLRDLQTNKGFWYPALNAITGIRPFDSKDAGNTRRMTQGWIAWGHKKGLI
jgi:hypothetical protein